MSCEEIDFLVDQARKMGVTGSRIMGGGFGGCTINLVPDSLYDSFVTDVPQLYSQRFGRQCRIIPVSIGGPAARLPQYEQ